MTFAEVTFAEIAAELGVDERSARRIADAMLAKLREGLGDVTPELAVKAIVLVLAERDGSRNYSSTENAGILKVPRRFSGNVGSGVDHAGHLPRRWSKP